MRLTPHEQERLLIHVVADVLMRMYADLFKCRVGRRWPSAGVTHFDPFSLGDARERCVSDA